MCLRLTTHFSADRRARLGGITILELIVSIGLLAILMTFSLQTFRLVSRQQRTVEQRIVALQSVQAVAELAGNIPWDELTPAAMNRVEIPEPMKTLLPDSMLVCAVVDETDPIAKRITIELSRSGNAGRPDGTIRLTTWAFPDLLQPTE